jgi:hypothetical protein
MRCWLLSLLLTFTSVAAAQSTDAIKGIAVILHALTMLKELGADDYGSITVVLTVTGRAVHAD